MAKKRKSGKCSHERSQDGATLYYKFSWCCLCAGNINAMNFKCISNATGYIDGVYR